MNKSEMEAIWNNNKVFGALKNLKKLKEYVIRVEPKAFVRHNKETYIIHAPSYESAASKAKEIYSSKYPDLKIDEWGIVKTPYRDAAQGVFYEFS